MIDLAQERETIESYVQRSDSLIADRKEELLSRFENDSQRWIVRHYLNLLRELCAQAVKCLLCNAYSATEALSRIVIEQSANLLYVSIDDGEHGLALLKSSWEHTHKNGNNWLAYLKAQGLHNAAAHARQENGAALTTAFKKRWPNVKHYPGVRQLFSEIGWEDYYHAFYAPLCDSVHSFSEDFSNIVGIGELFNECPRDGAQMLLWWETERRRLATYHCAVAVGLRGEAFARICDTTHFTDVIGEMQEITKDLQRLVDRHEQFDHSRVMEPAPDPTSPT